MNEEKRVSKGRVAVVTLGCPKNEVDSDYIAGALSEAGYQIVIAEEQADVLIINTCGFITAAKEESIATILQWARIKKENGRPLLVVTGCLVERYGRELWTELPEVDGFGGVEAARDVALLAAKVLAGQRVPPAVVEGFNQFPLPTRRLTAPAPFAYLKIAEGCDHRCSFCAIPAIRGPYRSRPLPDIVSEARSLAALGVRELVLVAQDTSFYGRDREQEGLPALLAALAAIPEITWLRLLYAHPEHLSSDIVQVMADEEKIVPYLDVPLQHVSRSVLRSMGRRGGREEYLDLVAWLRSELPGVTLRTTFIVGFPGEGENEFADLLSFMEEAQFDWAGVFIFSPEEGTRAFSMTGQVNPEEAEARYNQAMLLQQEITARRNLGLRGKIIPVLVDHRDREEPRRWVCRGAMHAPEVDGVVYVEDESLIRGQITGVQVIDTTDYDCVGRLV